MSEAVASELISIPLFLLLSGSPHFAAYDVQVAVRLQAYYGIAIFSALFLCNAANVRIFMIADEHVEIFV
jgi:hypothetical protein